MAKRPELVVNETDRMWYNAMGFVLKEVPVLQSGYCWYNKELELSVRSDALHTTVVRTYRDHLQFKMRNEMRDKFRDFLFDLAGLDTTHDNTVIVDRNC